MTFLWKNIQKFDSSDQSVSKFVYTNDNAVVETVLYKYPTYEDRTVICCSTQSGCMRGCAFCGSGKYFNRNLLADEIVEQVVYVLSTQIDCDANSIKKLQIMMMSMGEPFDNYDNVEQAIRKLNVMYPNAALLISTSAPVRHSNYSRFIDLSVEIPNIGLQISVHESTDENRIKLIPSKSLTLKEMGELGERWFKATNRKPFFNYCVHVNNNSIDDVTRLHEVFNPYIWEATLSVICERDENIKAAHERQEKLVYDFMQLMLQNGYSCRMFNPSGQDDIGGGCGQLFFVQNWMKTHPEFAKPSVGNKT